MKPYAYAILFVLLLAFSAEAADYYVATTGNDSNPGTLAEPFRTVVKGHSVLEPGDTLYIRGGNYNETCGCNMRSGTSWNAPITISRYQNENVVFLESNIFQFLGTSYVIWDGITVDQALDTAIWIGRNSHNVKFLNITITNGQSFGFQWNRVTPADAPDVSPHHITIQNCTISNMGLAGPTNAIYIKGNDNIVDGCNISNVPGSGIQAYDSGNAVNLNRNNIFRNNRIDDMPAGMPGWSQALTDSNWAHGIVFNTGPNTQVYNNVITRIHSGANHTGTGTGILVMSGNSGSMVYNNTVGDIADSGPGIGIQSADSTVQIKNNLLFSNTAHFSLFQSSATFATNLCDSAETGCAVVGDPLFVNAAGGNYALQASSPAINAGTASIADGVTRAFNGAGVDIGAFETFGAASAEVGLVANDIIVITITDNVAQPVLPASGITGFTTTCGTISSAARSGNTEIRLQLSGAATPPCTYSYSTGTGNVTNSALIGNSHNQRLNAITTVAVTDNTAASGPTLAYVTGRFYLLQGATDTAWTALAAAATGVTLPPGAKVNWRFKIANTGDAVNVNPRVYVSYDGGAYAALGVTFTNAVKMLGNNTQLGTVMTDGSSITQDQLASTHGNVACTYNRSAVSTPTLALTTNSESECAVAIEFDTTAVAAKVYNFKVYTDSGTEIGGPMAVTIGNYQAFR